MCLNKHSHGLKNVVHFKYGWFIVRMIFPESGSVSEMTQPLLRTELHVFISYGHLKLL